MTIGSKTRRRFDRSFRRRGPRRAIGLVFAALFATGVGHAQVGTQEAVLEREQEDEGPGILGHVVVIATRAPRPAFDTPFSIDLVLAEEIWRKSYRSTPRILAESPGVFVQETSHGQGSPYIRGFTGFRNVLLVDGIRLNNSVFRAGPNQYWNTVDPFSIERLEIVKGPSSVLYGSDAIGGTVNILTRRPSSRLAANRPVDGRVATRVASAENSYIGRVEVSAAVSERTHVLLGATGKTFGDLVGGDRTGTQANTGYDEWDADVKLEHALGEDRRLTIAFQQVKQNGVPRTHKTVHAVPFRGTTVGSDLRHDLDQERRLLYAKLTAEDYSLGVSWHEQREERDRITGGGARDISGFDVGTFGVQGSATVDASFGRVAYGFEYYRDAVDSFSTTNAIQGPVADDATYESIGVFVQDEIEVSDRLTVLLGARFNNVAVDANRVFDPSTGTAIEVEDDWNRVVGSARFLARVNEDVHLFGGASQGFRAPNLSDLTRFDSARTNEFELPSPGLEPETAITYELGVKCEGDRTSSQFAVFYTDLDDAIQRVPTGTTNGAGEFEITKANVGDGYVFGVEFGGAWEFTDGWTLFGTGTYLDGKAETFPTSAPVLVDEYLDRLMPTTAQLGLAFEEAPDDVGASRGRWAECALAWTDDADRLSTRDRGDTSRIPPGGTPGHFVVNLRGGARLGASLRLDVALENVFDEDYRVHGSGQNAPGRNLIVGLTYAPGRTSLIRRDS